MKNKISRRALVATVLIENRDKMLRSRDVYNIISEKGFSINISDVDYIMWRLKKVGHVIQCTSKQPVLFKAADELTIDIVNNIRSANISSTKKPIFLTQNEQIVYNNKYDQLSGTTAKIPVQYGTAYKDTMTHGVRLVTRNKVYVGCSFSIV